MRHLFLYRLAWMVGLLSVLADPEVQAAQPFATAPLEKIDAAINQAIAEKRLPGGVLWLEHKHARYQKTYGQRALLPEPEPMTSDTIFDAASLTKVIATTPAIM